MASALRAAAHVVASTLTGATIAPAPSPARRAAPCVGRRRSCCTMKTSLPSPAIAAVAAAVRSDASFDEDEGDEDFDPFEDWDDLPSISPASSSSSDGGAGGGGIASLRSFTDALRGEVRRSLVVSFPFLSLLSLLSKLPFPTTAQISINEKNETKQADDRRGRCLRRGAFGKRDGAREGVSCCGRAQRRRRGWK